MTIDAGDAHHIHSPDKRIFGARLAALARRDVYGESIVAEGPAALAAVQNETRLTVSFRPSPSAVRLRTQGRPEHSFLVRTEAGSSIVPLRAQLSGGRLALLLPPGTRATAIGYAQSSDPDPVLFNAAGWPAPPFELAIFPPR